MKSRTKKIALVALLVLACALIADLIVAEPILNKGVVIGMGIDRTERGEIGVTIQIAVAGESSAPGIWSIGLLRHDLSSANSVAEKGPACNRGGAGVLPYRRLYAILWEQNRRNRLTPAYIEQKHTWNPAERKEH